MKTIKFFGLAFLALFLSGCYTQLAIEERRTEKYDSYETQGDEYVGTDTVYYDEETQGDDQVINNYYVLPGYRKYLSHYYPSTTIVVGTGYYFDYWLWDTWYPHWWYCDPWYPPVAYYPFWYYHPNYYGYGWYSDNYYEPSTYRYRDNNMSRVRGNEGGRGSYTRRDAIKAYDRTRPSVTRDRIGVTGEGTGTSERTRIDANETPRPGRVTGTDRRTAPDTENRGTVRERNRSTESTEGVRPTPKVQPREKTTDRQPSGERKTIYVPRQRKTDGEKKPDVQKEPEKRRTPPSEGYSGRRSNPSPSYTPPSNSGGSRQSTPSNSGGSRSRGSSSNDSPRRSR